MSRGACRRVRLALVLAVGLLQAGCWGIPPIERAGLVSLLAVDAAPAGGYQVTLAISSPPGMAIPGIGGAGASKSPVLLRQATAVSVGAALRRIVAESYLSLNATHLEGVLVGEGVARSGLATPLNYLATTPEAVTTPWLLVSRGQSAADVLQALKQAQPRAGEVLIDTVIQDRERGADYADHLFTFLKQLPMEGDEPVTAGVTVAGKPDMTGTALRLTSLALFRGDRLVGWLQGPAALGWLVATGRAHFATLVVPTPAGSYTLQLIGDQRRLRVTRGPSGPQVEIAVRVAARLIDVPRLPADFAHAPDQVEALQAAAVRVLTADVRSALAAARSDGTDVFSLGQYVRVADPVAWRTLRPHWNQDGFPRLAVALHVKVRLHSLGQLVCPLLLGCAPRASAAS